DLERVALGVGIARLRHDDHPAVRRGEHRIGRARHVARRVTEELDDEKREEPEGPGPAEAAGKMHQQGNDEGGADERPALAGDQGMRVVWVHRPAWLVDSGISKAAGAAIWSRPISRPP